MGAAERKERRLQLLDTRRERVAQILKVNPVVKMEFPGIEGQKILEFNNRAAIGILEDTGHNILRDPVTAATFNPKYLTAVLYWGLRRHWPEVKLDDLDDLVNIHHFAYYYERIASALNVVMPDIADIEEEEKAINAQEEAEKRSPLPIADAG